MTCNNNSYSSSTSDGLNSVVTMPSPDMVVNQKISIQHELRKLKLKKDAHDYVDYLKEYQQDPKYKTELCKTFNETGFCAYGNKCRFAHGRYELFDKVITCKKYKQKECMSFYKNKFCCYGIRCHFKHEERRLEDIDRSYYLYLVRSLQNAEHLDVWSMDEKELSQVINSNRKRSSFLEGKGVQLGKRNPSKTKMVNSKLSSIDCSYAVSKKFNYNGLYLQ